MIRQHTCKIAYIIVCSLLSLSATARGDGIPFIVITGTSGNLQEAAPTLNRVSAAVGPSAWTGPSLSEALHTRFGRPAPVLNTRANIRTRVDAARASYTAAVDSNDTAAMNTALTQLEQIASELEAEPDLLATFADVREQHARALLFVANVTLRDTPQRADDALRRMVSVDAQQVLSARTSSTAVRTAFQQQIATLATAGLVVQSVAPGCEVFRDGRSVGRAPAQLSNLTPGSHHRISLLCAGQHSLLHPVLVAQGSTSTVSVDVQLDQALESNETPALRYGNLEQSSSRWVSDLAALGTALGAARMFGVIPSQDKVIVVDVVSGTLAGESPITDGALLRRLANGATVSSIANSQPNPHTAVQAHNSTSNNGNSGNSASTSEPANTVRPPQVGVGGNEGVQARQQPIPLFVTQQVTTGYPATTIVIETLGLGALGTGIGMNVLANNSLNRAEQISTAELAAQRPTLLSQSQLYRTVAIAGYATAGALIVTGLLVGVFARDTRLVRIPAGVTAFVVPREDGVLAGIGGAL